MLTRQQSRLLDFISVYTGTRGYAPTFEEMKTAIGLKSKSGVHRLIDGLVERGFIRKLAYRVRAIEVLQTIKQPPDLRSQIDRILDDEARAKPEASGALASAKVRIHGALLAGEARG
jgi:repressor LexA